MEYQDHPLASILPLMGQMELKEMAADIQIHGQRAPITLLDGLILDGRNRYRACVIAKVEPKFRNYNGDGDPVAFIVSANVKRRHLTPSQRAMVAARLAQLPKGDISRISENAKTPMISQTATLRTAEIIGKSVKQAAKELEVGTRTVETAKKVLRTAPPEEIEKVERGEKTVTEVARATKATKPKAELDKTNYPIPESILPEWQRATDTAKSLLSQVSSVRSELKNALKESDLIFAEVTNTTIADLDNAYTSLKCVSPYAVCTSCQGHNRKKCSLCKSRGFISEFAWRSFVPAEIKKLRGQK